MCLITKEQHRLGISALGKMPDPYHLLSLVPRCYELELQNCFLNELSVTVSRRQSGNDELFFSCHLGKIWVREARMMSGKDLETIQCSSGSERVSMPLV